MDLRLEMAVTIRQPTSKATTSHSCWLMLASEIAWGRQKDTRVMAMGPSPPPKWKAFYTGRHSRLRPSEGWVHQFRVFGFQLTFDHMRPARQLIQLLLRGLEDWVIAMCFFCFAREWSKNLLVQKKQTMGCSSSESFWILFGFHYLGSMLSFCLSQYITHMTAEASSAVYRWGATT